ncbi:MAG: hypothetical protein ACK4TA_21265 [Saprospiraceae bacterium]
MATTVERMLANNLADFEGLKLEGTIVLNEALLNAFIQDYINNLGKEPTAQTPGSVTTELDLPRLLQSLCVDQLEVHLQEGKMNIQLKISK